MRSLPFDVCRCCGFDPVTERSCVKRLSCLRYKDKAVGGMRVPFCSSMAEADGSCNYFISINEEE